MEGLPFSEGDGGEIYLGERGGRMEEEIEQEHEGKKVVVSRGVWAPSGSWDRQPMGVAPAVGLGGVGRGRAGRTRRQGLELTGAHCALELQSPGYSSALFSSLSTPSCGCFPHHRQ